MPYTQHIRLLEFAIKHNLIITPIGWRNHIAQYDKLGHCPCEATRPECPCPEAIGEVKAKGHCSCSLFWRDYPTYLQQCYPTQ